ncbi:MAG: hypothetical protein FJ284_02795 [Planctomycetes bacterium]|nr:hypothetical protein [Planctomycetota bacterium]
MSRLSFLMLSGLAALLLSAGSAQAGPRHRHTADPTCGCEAGCVEPGCSAFTPACGALEPDCGADPCCLTQPCIKYHHKRAHRRKHACGCCPEPTYETVLMPTSPETCRAVAVPVCLPACCQGCPCESSRCTLFGCGQVRYDYACGWSVIVRFQKSGDILVIYEGF